ncbi:DNA polymerase alpha/epsilon subunit B-domain-containing protein [Dichomitus squalens]|nr:DNA polymerase alpha/epsilon subunit B-domain-containing protein [Dichomitus squalens]
MRESSRMMGSGARVQLCFDPNVKVRKGKQGLGGQALFPGAIVALKGKNGGGGAFLATELLSLPPLDPPSAALIKAESGDTQFTMHTLVAKRKAAKPAITLLVGPFIDASHPSIKIGDVDSTPTEIFRTEFVDRLRDFLDSSPGSIALLVPNTRDIVSSHAGFPQPELSGKLCTDSRICFLPNPVRFTVNGLHFAASSVDVLFHLRKEEFFKRATEVEPLVAPADPEDGEPVQTRFCSGDIFPIPLDLAHEF